MSLNKSLAALVAVAVLSSTAAFAAGPAVTDVNARTTNQEARVNAGVAAGTVTPKQAAKDDKRIDKVQTKAAKDEAKNGGTLTKKQSKNLNKSLNKDSKGIAAQKAQ
jgi:hypothetical protein